MSKNFLEVLLFIDFTYRKDKLSSKQSLLYKICLVLYRSIVIKVLSVLNISETFFQLFLSSTFYFEVDEIQIFVERCSSVYLYLKSAFLRNCHISKQTWQEYHIRVSMVTYQSQILNFLTLYKRKQDLHKKKKNVQTNSIYSFFNCLQLNCILSWTDKSC